MGLLDTYYNQPDRVLERILFAYMGCTFEGRGVLTWDQGRGFHVEAPLKRKGKLPRKIEFLKRSIIQKSDLCSIRMLERNSKCQIVISQIPMRDRFDVITQDRLSLNVGRALFYDHTPKSLQPKDTWKGIVLYRLRSKPILPDNIQTEIRLDGEKIESGISFSGIKYDSSDGHIIIGRMINDNYLELLYELPVDKWSWLEAWRWAKGAQFALSFYLGESVVLLLRKFIKKSRTYTEVLNNIEPESLRSFSPTGNDPVIDRDNFITLSNFIARNSHEAKACIKIFGQIAEVTRQYTWQARELFLATILEAALRTIEKKPFSEKDKSFRVDKALKKFRNTHLSKDWKNTCNRVLKTQRKLRNRNAHPDWLYEETGARSDKSRSDTLNDMIFLSRFYGDMIESMAGIKRSPPELKT